MVQSWLSFSGVGFQSWEWATHLSTVLDARQGVSTVITLHAHFHLPSTALQPAAAFLTITAFEATEATRRAWNEHTLWFRHAHVARSLEERCEGIISRTPIRQGETREPMQLEHKALGETLWMPSDAMWRSEKLPGIFITLSCHIGSAERAHYKAIL
ncbi:hypothetical protein COCSADRAFT_33197 [Bipolaris sorokiniana ND90Pr]|uniref:Uncharacterized protein n=1 Tax=Cochliobolus sativus (strain ND90Pr / ATCC 201652) TaxID=665912 RepID=M2THQ6_COCSN|nr:uncharacterized protein COCSADRAFT_33197 [Bipolaris sorokiniana ND90Pr]EMD68247.1 hypothetical protein COCSADRAFT_33197 [Bipolaris sorokiniana ND90Pr]